MKHVNVYLASGFEEIEAITIIDVLRRANIAVNIVSIEENLMVKGSHDIEIKADMLFAETKHKEADMLVLPGGMPGSENLNRHAGLKKQIELFSRENKYLSAICAAPMVYGEMGILENQKYVCYPGFEKTVKGGELQEEKVVVSGNFLTAKGPGAAIEFSLKIVEVLLDKNMANELRKKMIAE